MSNISFFLIGGLAGQVSKGEKRAKNGLHCDRVIGDSLAREKRAKNGLHSDRVIGDSLACALRIIL